LRILIVDDSKDSVAMLARLLRLEGAIVETACDGTEAIRIADAGNFDLFLCDISMPGMDGYELLRLLRARPGSGEVPAIALTGFGRREDIERAIAAGFADHLTKPVGLEKLIDAARRVVGHRSLGI
jgi:two-component system CheB/CheR fusion protein